MVKLTGFFALAFTAISAKGSPLNSVVFNTAPVPTLDEIGIAVLTLAVAVAGGIAARRRRDRKTK
jgi:hypothetical protein